MKKLSLLILTDHSRHSKYNSLYPLVNALRYFGDFTRIAIASKGYAENAPFFDQKTTRLWVKEVTTAIQFKPQDNYFLEALDNDDFTDYDIVLLRLPPPIPESQLNFLEKVGLNQLIINHPRGIRETSDKSYLLNYPELCPLQKVCRSVKDLQSFKRNHPVVLKPLNGYGGSGLIKLDGDQVWKGNEITTWIKFIEDYQRHPIPYLGVKFLKNVTRGDKRIIVINHEILGASIRYPAKGSWLCNLSQGGEAMQTSVEARERFIISRIDPELSKKGIIMYGVDTLVDDEGKRVLSEINTTSIGGLYMANHYTGEPIVNEAAKVLRNFIKQRFSHAGI